MKWSIPFWTEFVVKLERPKVKFWYDVINIIIEVYVGCYVHIARKMDVNNEGFLSKALGIYKWIIAYKMKLKIIQILYVERT